MRPTQIVDLFAGPGGLDVAAEKLGIETIGLEWDSSACTTRRAAGLNTIEGDVRDYSPSDFPQANVLTGGPPCQTFTVAGSGTGRRALDDVLAFARRMVAREDRYDIKRDLEKMDDDRTGLVLEPLRWALEAIDNGSPYQAIILEQVPAVLPVWESYSDALQGEGYSTAFGVLQTEAYGIPQTRKRAVLIARLGEEPIHLPAPTHRTYRKGVPRTQGDATLAPWVRIKDVLDRGSSFFIISNYGTGGDPKARGKRSSSEPSATVTGKISRNRLIAEDGTEMPRLTPSEAGRLQTFPVDYPWSGGDISQQIGNAIPPRLGMHILSSAFNWPTPSIEMLNSLTRWSQQPHNSEVSDSIKFGSSRASKSTPVTLS